MIPSVKRAIVLAGIIILGIPNPISGQEPERRMTLVQAVETALVMNPSVRAAEWQGRAAEHEVREGRSSFFPRVSASGSYTRFEEPTTVTPIHEVGQFPPLDDQIYETGIQMNVPILNGRAWAQVDAAKASAAAARVEEREARTDLIEQITRLFIGAKELEVNQLLLESHLEALRQRRQEMSLLEDEGRVSSSDVALVDASIDAAESDRLNLESRWTEFSHLLGQLVGLDHPVRPEPFELDTDWYRQMGIGKNDEPTGPAVLKAQARVDQAEALRSAARRSFWPDLNGFAGYTLRSGSELDFSGEWAAGISLRVPLFEGGRRIAAAEAAQASVNAAEERQRAARIAERTRLSIAVETRETTRSRRSLLERAVANKETAVQAHRDRYDAGRISLSDLLGQETELLELRSRESSLLFREVLALVDYHAIRGTLTVDRIEGMMKE